MQFTRSSLVQPHWVYQPGIAFSGLLRRCERAPHRAGGTGGEVTASIAGSPDKLRAAAALVDSRYAARGYRLIADDDERRPGITLVATEADAVIGTLTLRVDGPHGLAADESYAETIGAVREAGGGVCELTRLAITSDADSRSVLSALFSTAYVVARQVHRMTDAFVEVNPRHVQFYRRMFGFAVAAGQRICPRVMAPAVLLRLEIERLEARLAEVGVAAHARFDPPALAAA